jgi:LacI family transcriptional regulator, galactose operon repressor
LPRSPGYEGRQRPSVYEVAERAGVSIATVSRVLRGSAPVAPETRARVLDAARELRWRPSRLAQAFVKQAHGAVGIVFPDLAGPYYSRVIAGFEHEVVERKAAALILGTHGKADVEQLVLDLADRVDGLVIMGRTVSDEFVSTLERSDTPVVLLARSPVGDVPAVQSASLASAEALTEHVLAHGRRRVAFLGEPDLSPDTSERWRGVRRVLRRHGIDTSNVVVPCGGFDVEHGYKTGLEVLADPQRFDAVICVNDEVASGVYRAAATVGRRVPDDVAITGWDDTAMATRLHPPLTTVRQPMRDLGARAAARLFDRIDGKAASSVVLRTSVVVRQSCGCHGQATREKSRGPEAGSQLTKYQVGRDGRPT